MFAFKTFVILSAVAGAYGAPVQISKRIAQVIADSTAKWEQACLTAGGSQQCNPLSITAFTTLLAAAGPCDQQNAADQMIDLAKQLNNDADMIKFTQIFAQQPRNTPDSLAVPYCQQAPQNQELNGLFQCQYQGANQKLFVGNIAVGGQGTIPFGQNSPLSPAGSCAANPNGPIADGSQLTDITDDPGVGSTGGSSNSSDSGNDSGNTGDSGDDSGDVSDSGDSSTDSGSTSDSGDSGDDSGDSTDDSGDSSDNSGDDSSDTGDSSDSSDSSDTGSSTSSFALSNGQEAQQLNSQFASLDASSSCQAGENACVNGQFAQCVGGSFVLESCAATTQCFALPLVNSAGTSITCTTQSDAESRIAATGATGGLTGSN
ncbi:hypothetical protein SCHPADRAFT_886494 [Schizopora paradoxa]|uniref:Carbohydrate-binding module family 19 domain-containing protein n=1 Tax=Schizopora paradoxa TaxID=27342 RepID=A0A0H2SLU3_9AGAM|nr:hypothetical protein SCHPADRAFT_886494 [Schizopora paradoxa]